MLRHLAWSSACLVLIGVASSASGSFTYTSLASNVRGQPGSGGLALGGVAPFAVFGPPTATVRLLDIGLFAAQPATAAEHFTIGLTATVTLTDVGTSRSQGQVVLALVLTFSRVDSQLSLSTATVNGVSAGAASATVSLGGTSYVLDQFVYRAPSPTGQADGGLNATISADGIVRAAALPAAVPEPGSIALLGLAGCAGWLGRRGRAGRARSG